MEHKCLGFFTNPNKPDALKETVKAVGVALSKGYPCSVSRESIEAVGLDIPEFSELTPDCIIALGGDGTILRASPYALMYNAPVLGVNLGRIGFLSETDPSGLMNALERIEAGDYTLDSRMMLHCSINGEKEYDCLNDVLLYKKSFSGVAEISVTVDGVDAGRVFCDGLVISTPTGATGYSISAGGPVIAPGLEASIITPVCPHTLGFRTIMAAKDAKLRFALHGSGLVAVDGIYVADVDEHDGITVSCSEHRIQFIRLGERNLYKLIKDRLS